MKLIAVILLFYLIRKLFSIFFSNYLNVKKDNNIIDAEFEEVE